MIDPDGLVYETLLEEDTIQARIAELAAEIRATTATASRWWSAC